MSSYPLGKKLADKHIFSATKSGKVGHTPQVSPVRVPGKLAHGSAFRASQKDQRRGAEENDGYPYSSNRNPQPLSLGITGFGLLTDRETEIVEALADLVLSLIHI